MRNLMAVVMPADEVRFRVEVLGLTGSAMGGVTNADDLFNIVEAAGVCLERGWTYEDRDGPKAEVSSIPLSGAA